MRYPIHVLNRTFIRGLRRRPPTQKPAEFIEDATTFADTHTVLNDPFSRLPYPPNQLVDYLNKAQKSNLEKVAKKTMLKTQYLGGALNFDHIPIEKQVFVFFPGQVTFGMKSTRSASSGMYFRENGHYKNSATNNTHSAFMF